MTTDEFLKLAASTVVADPSYDRFAQAFQAATAVPDDEVRRVFAAVEAAGGSVGEAMGQIFESYPTTDTLDVKVADIRRMGARPERDRIYVLERELEALRPALAAWYRFIGEPQPGED